ncbi:PREDICTED: yrdC domain-containing protein, mitochondrial [Trachymyrmex cornetzi]|uniref:Threonylcarbamoyl-AMP synthase n=1 Tax=Trachymyrmex cornetzi TaxID=471704 RepID=A0A151JLJ5_9HYME|nr:PREDICTED: yrdC domain-containing protein, mitochondrial [Trachymyrmex cornetzi]KYN26635.1 YrdC domain-containing protein, mitochondrial [Trachymyrmex cornetzi]
MLQSRVCSHVASRLTSQEWNTTSIRYIMSPSSMGPMKVIMNKAKEEMKMLGPKEKHFFCGGDRSVAMAAELLRQGKVIAVPTDTVYGLACLAANSHAVQRLYEIKQRDERKPLAVCLSNVKEVGIWGIIDDIPAGMLEDLLPGPYTICLRRTFALNEALNPGIDTVGIRVPNDKFIRSVAQIVGPLALTSANVSKEPSSLHPDEFRALWPELDGVFHSSNNLKKQTDARRIGSTVVDVSKLGCYSIVRRGISAHVIISILNRYRLKMNPTE